MTWDTHESVWNQVSISLLVSWSMTACAFKRSHFQSAFKHACALIIVANHRRIRWVREHKGQSEVFTIPAHQFFCTELVSCSVFYRSQYQDWVLDWHIPMCVWLRRYAKCAVLVPLGMWLGTTGLYYNKVIVICKWMYSFVFSILRTGTLKYLSYFM